MFGGLDFVVGASTARWWND